MARQKTWLFRLGFVLRWKITDNEILPIAKRDVVREQHYWNVWNGAIEFPGGTA